MRGRCDHCGDLLGRGETPSATTCMDCLIEIDIEAEIEAQDRSAFVCVRCGDAEPDFADSTGLCNYCAMYTGKVVHA